MPSVLWAFLVAVSAVLGGCATKHSAPVIERAPAVKKTAPKSQPREADWRPQTHTVQKGETLYGISLEYGFDYKELAELNGIEPPYIIRIGQQLRIAAAQQVAVATPLKPAPAVVEKTPEAVPAPANALLKTQPKAAKVPYSAEAERQPSPVVAKAEAASVKPVPPSAKPAAVEEDRKAAALPEDGRKKETAPVTADDDDNVEWNWPVTGKILAGFNENASAKGVDIAGKTGQPVLAAAPGKVVYSGSGLRGYGKLVIIKHNKTYLSAYAHNSQILVKEGQGVLKGQRIAEMGDTDTDRVKLHFEIRRLGKPVDPVKYLPAD